MNRIVSVTQPALIERDMVDELEAGTVTALFVAPAGGEPMISRAEVEAVSGKGLVGDRYFNNAGSFSRRRVAGREVTDITLVELEVIEKLRSRGLELDPAVTRRNLVTRGVALNDFTDSRFWVGHVQLLGVNLCEPCASLFAPESRRDALRGLAHKGGLRARILSDGTIRTGDAITRDDVPRGQPARSARGLRASKLPSSMQSPSFPAPVNVHAVGDERR